MVAMLAGALPSVGALVFGNPSVSSSIRMFSSMCMNILEVP